jgi:DNA-binding IclR family transcriptional regulator
MNAYEMAQKFLSHMTLLRKARPLMERLARQCDESVYLAVRRGEDVLFLDMIDTGQQVKLASLVGRRFPLGSLSAGKVIKAFSSSAVEVGGETQASELQMIRRVGFACDVGGGGDGVVCMAVPIFSGRGDVVGSLALLGPDFRLSQRRLMGELRTLLLDAAGVVSSGLGYLGYFEQSKRWLAAAPVEGPIALSA